MLAENWKNASKAKPRSAWLRHVRSCLAVHSWEARWLARKKEALGHGAHWGTRIWKIVSRSGQKGTHA